MAVTETPPETVDAASETATSTPRSQPTGLAAVLGSGDHKVVGRLFIGFSLLFGALVVVLGEAFAIEAIEPDTLDVFDRDTAYQLFTLMRVGSIFMLALPLVIGVAMVVVPLQVGARSIAFPRAAAASFWGWLLGSALVLASYAMNGGPGGGSPEGVNLWIASLGLIVVALVVASICLATTVLALRSPGLTLDRVPLYAWSVGVAAIMWLLTLPVLFGMLVLMYVDHRHAGGIAMGTSSSLYGSLSWLLRNPQVYVVAIPVLGFVADVLITTSGARLKLRTVAQGAIAAFGAFTFGAFLVAPSVDALESPTMMVLAMVALIPILALVASVADVFRSGTFKLNAGVLYAISALLILLLGVAAGALGTIPGVLEAPEGASLSANVFFLGVGHAVMLSAVIASLGGIHWWATKVGRRPANEKLGMIAPVVLLVGAAAASIPDMISGIAGDGSELFADYTGGIVAMNGVTAAGILVLMLGLALSLASFAPLLKTSDDDVASDPWDGQTLEWLTPSPPPVGNFVDDLDVVTSPEPLYDLRQET